MDKTILVIALSILFQTVLYAEGQQETDRAKPPEPTSKIVTPKSGSYYDLNGIQTQDDQHKSSYSTKSLDHRDEKPPKQKRGQQEKLNTDVNNPSGVGVLIIVDE
ncbi:hypothetical protein MNBD_GAMMA06-534 [hydrothermal vent metagenome]|uniref:Uncharacterized protein n=1 Tax=hydrothermal vent metagenome TaxID=652676 RepID=A0A3B0WQE3_9ZZZZ